MILSRAHRFIFVKTRKTAGTSIEMALSQVVTGEDDIVTPTTDEHLRPAACPPRNFERRVPPHRWLAAPARRQLRQGRLPTEKVFWHHISAAAIRDRIPDEWDRCFTFAFVRNPWDYVVSRYFWERHRNAADLAVDDVLARWDPGQNWEQITIDGEVAVDFVGRYEDLTRDLSTALDRIGVEIDGPLPRAKADTGRSGHGREILEPRHVDHIAERCAAEIERFGYRY